MLGPGDGQELAAACGNEARPSRREAVWTRGGESRAERRRGPGISELRGRPVVLISTVRLFGVPCGCLTLQVWLL